MLMFNLGKLNPFKAEIAFFAHSEAKTQFLVVNNLLSE